MARFAFATAVAAALLVAAPVEASAPPVGKLPRGPVTTIATTKGALVSVALPHRAGGLVWRQAHGVSSRVLRQVSEADVGKDVVVLFRAVGRGTVTLAYGLTRGETGGARASLTFRVSVR